MPLQGKTEGLERERERDRDRQRQTETDRQTDILNDRHSEADLTVYLPTEPATNKHTKQDPTNTAHN